jgi:hypothetical protein
MDLEPVCKPSFNSALLPDILPALWWPSLSSQGYYKGYGTSERKLQERTVLDLILGIDNLKTFL